jgi:hypothetical protein
MILPTPFQLFSFSAFQLFGHHSITPSLQCSMKSFSLQPSAFRLSRHGSALGVSRLSRATFRLAPAWPAACTSIFTHSRW